MTLDVPTLIVVTVFISSMAGVLMIISWLQNRSVPALLWWGGAYLCGASAAAMLGGRGELPDFVSINIANVILLASAGLAWCGLRAFDGRPVMLWHALCGGVVWLAACEIGAFYQSMPARVALASAISAIYTALCVWELWRSRGDGLMSRWLALGIFSLHGSVYLLRIGFTWWLDLPPDVGLFDLAWLPLGLFEALFYAFGTAFILLTMTKERAETRHRLAATIDPLTGAPNRRGFIDRAEQVLAKCRQRNEPVALLLFDLDHFKRINDTYGHQAGDEILVSFCTGVQSRLGPNDVFGRLGGEEFVCLQPGATPQSGLAAAERIRTDFDAARWAGRTDSIHATVSIGIAHSVEVGAELAALFAAADKALYQAKAKGRNRVEWRRPSLALVAGPIPQGAA